MTYDVANNEFSDGFSIDWFVWESVDTTHVFKDDVLKPITMAHLDAMLTSTVSELSVPVSRHGETSRTIDCSKCKNVRQLLMTIYAFYQTVIDEADIGDATGTDGYIEDVRANLKKGLVKVTRTNLIGSTEYMHGNEMIPTEDRRSCFSCSGLVRYEGITDNGNGNMVLTLGS